MQSVLFLLAAVTTAFGFSVCPERQSIYPCSCMNIGASKNFKLTVVSCHHVQDSAALERIFHVLRSMVIDRFQLYDSFWKAHQDGEEAKKVLPNDWLTVLKVKEIEIVDTPLDSGFACAGGLLCRNTVTTRFTAINGSSSEKISPLCKSGNTSYPWTGCMRNLKYFQYSHGKLTSLSEIFPTKMSKLIELNLSYNRISMIHPKVLKNIPSLAKLDLSHNLIESLDNLFSGDRTAQLDKLELLDLSWNAIKAIGPNVFSALQTLKTFSVAHNFIDDLVEKDLIKAPKSIREIDITGNPLHCGCNIRWITNSKFPKQVLVGKCATPDEYHNSYIRIAALAVEKRCDETGNFRTKKDTVVTTPKF